MGLGDVTGVLSRYFVLGYFVPAFVTLFLMSRLLTEDLLPGSFEDLSERGQLVVVGAGALIVGLVLLGLRYPIIRILEGYPLDLGPLGLLGGPLVRLQQWSYDRLAKRRDDENSPKRSSAARLLDRRFHKTRDRLLPTRFGNAFRAAENYSYTRWGLDSVAVWPRIDAMLTERETELHTNAMSDLAFFVNGTLGALAVGIVTLVDAALNSPLEGSEWLWYITPFVVAYLLYRAGIGAAERLGTERRASIDVHRRELLERLGVMEGNSTQEERKIASAVNQLLLYGRELPDAYRRRESLVKGVEMGTDKRFEERPQPRAGDIEGEPDEAFKAPGDLDKGRIEIRETEKRQGKEALVGAVLAGVSPSKERTWPISKVSRTSPTISARKKAIPKESLTSSTAAARATRWSATRKESRTSSTALRQAF